MQCMTTTQFRIPYSTKQRTLRIKNPVNRQKQVLQKALATGTEVSSELFQWLQQNGAPEQGVKLAGLRDNVEVEVTVAAKHLNPGDVAFAIPFNLVVTLNRIFEDETVAELLTTDKISELACLALYLCYEKKRGSDSFWYPFIKCMDKQRARGPQAVETPLLWEPQEAERLLKGSPILDALKGRYAGIKKEYENLDTVWFMAGSLFRDYPYDVPTEQFPFEVFLQAFAAVQSSIVHLQKVPLAKRFALLPLGPPMLTYSSTSRGMIQYDSESDQVVLHADKEYQEGQPVNAWCGPQPNSRLFVNYGMVDENNPYDQLKVVVTIPNTDPLYQLKRSSLQHLELSTQQAFQLQRNQDLPPNLLPFMRLACTSSEEDVKKLSQQFTDNQLQLDDKLEVTILDLLINYLKKRLEVYPTTEEQDTETIANPGSLQREVQVAKLVRIEKQVIKHALEQLYVQREKFGSFEGQSLQSNIRIA
eukprot:TRINITY_DN424_c0_g1_i2.p1 TRINITY_DN424_c0_g1~~TRINITY_DN424_c0_g1_i2.p1  ORF type:complete len:491 (-),score=44.36 TRINITY_DN424_c0_g1_i2:270-1694(-)